MRGAARTARDDALPRRGLAGDMITPAAKPMNVTDLSLDALSTGSLRRLLWTAARSYKPASA